MFLIKRFLTTSTNASSKMRSSTHFRKLNRDSSHRRALLRNQVTSLIKHNAIVTTAAKAKETRRMADKMVTLAKRGTLESKRRVIGYVQERAAAFKLIDELAPGYASRVGGYTRVQLVGRRKGDGALMARLEFVERRYDAASAAAVASEVNSTSAT